MTLRAGEPVARPPTAKRPSYPHNALVVRAFDPRVDDVGTSGDVEALGARLGSTLIRLQDLDDELAEGLARRIGIAGGRMEMMESKPGVAVLSISRASFEALRQQLLTAPQALLRVAEEIAAALRAYHRTEFEVPLPSGVLRCGARPLVMGVVNCTPDSFYEGSRTSGDEAVAAASSMVEQGAHVLDVGGESTRPGSEPISADEEIARVVPVIERLADSIEVPISIDTTKAAVARAAIDAGAAIVNDISGLAADPELGSVVAEAGAAVVLMHMRGGSAAMYAEASYADVVAEVAAELRAAQARALDAGIDSEAIILDPGIGFAKRAEHSLAALRGLGTLRSLGRPLLVGPSRKSFIGAVLDLPPEERLEGTAAAVTAAVLAGAHLVRVHDVEAMRRVASMAAAIRSGGVGWVC